MPLWNGITKVDGTRSQTQLVKSGHSSPAENWVLDPQFASSLLSSVFNNGILLTYMYGGPGMQEVVIPMGRLVSPNTLVKDFDSGKMLTTMCLPGMSGSGNAMGVVPYNICKDWTQADRFGGNKPSIITQEYISLPYIPSVTPSTFDVAGMLIEEKAISVDLKMPWGAVIGQVVNGDYLKSSASGRFCKWIRGTDDAADIVGMILAEDLNFEQTGWLKWLMWDPSVRNEDEAYINRSGTDLPSDEGYPFDPTYSDGDIDLPGIQSAYVTNPTGIPGLTDGSGNYMNYGINDTPFSDMPLGTISATVADNTSISIQAIDYAGGNVTNLSGTPTIYVDGVALLPARVPNINAIAGVFTIIVNAADAGKAVTATYTALHFGIPTYLDFKGVVGSVNVLLLK
jgi:hypothetical protein